MQIYIAELWRHPKNNKVNYRVRKGFRSDKFKYCEKIDGSECPPEKFTLEIFQDEKTDKPVQQITMGFPDDVKAEYDDRDINNRKVIFWNPNNKEKS